MLVRALDATLKDCRQGSAHDNCSFECAATKEGLYEEAWDMCALLTSQLGKSIEYRGSDHVAHLLLSLASRLSDAAPTLTRHEDSY